MSLRSSAGGKRQSTTVGRRAAIPAAILVSMSIVGAIVVGSLTGSVIWGMVTLLGAGCVMVLISLLALLAVAGKSAVRRIVRIIISRTASGFSRVLPPLPPREHD